LRHPILSAIIGGAGRRSVGLSWVYNELAGGFMGTFSIWHWLIVLAVVLILFGGGGKISKLMGDFGRGLKSFKKNLKEGEEGEATAEGAEAKKTIDVQAQQGTTTTTQPQQPAQSGAGAAPPASGNTRPS
jgi:sec-independent protein translocase protein TatA